MVLVKNPDRHLEKFLKDNQYEYEQKGNRKQKEKKERTAEQQEAINKRMADLRSKRQTKKKEIVEEEFEEIPQKTEVKLKKKIKKV